MRELTVRGVILGGFITLLFTAANVYLGLKVGLTFATSIPAAVISMALLRFFKDATILELLARVAGLATWVHVEKLSQLDGKPSYTKDQGED